MKLLELLLKLIRDPAWQGVGAIFAAIGAAVAVNAIPKVHSLFQHIAKCTAWRSFLVGTAVGGTVTLLGITMLGLYPYDLARQDTMLPGPYLKVVNDETNQPKLLEGSHYKLKPNTTYRIEILNPIRLGELGELIWQVSPEDFGKLTYNPALDSDAKIFAYYETPNIGNESSGFIRICKVDESNLCRSIMLPEIQFVLSSK